MEKIALFEPCSIKGVVLKNRIAMAPMCQYSAADDGMLTDWHRVHYLSRAVGQVGMIITEATAIERRGRISHHDLGIWDDAAVKPFAGLIKSIQSFGCRAGIQIAHAGRKAEVRDEAIVAPSPIPFGKEFQTPQELDDSEIGTLVLAFGKAVCRAVEAGVDFIEIHAAHGYLINQFLSPLTNRRSDRYGMDRGLFLKEVMEEVSCHVPETMPVFLRISAEEYMEEGNHPEDLAELLLPVRHRVDVVHVSSGGVVENAVINAFPGYQVEFAEKIRKGLDVPVMAVGMLESPQLAEQTLTDKRADFIALGRELLRNPYWPLHAAKTLGAEIDWPKAYLRARG